VDSHSQEAPISTATWTNPRWVSHRWTSHSSIPWCHKTTKVKVCCPIKVICHHTRITTIQCMQVRLCKEVQVILEDNLWAILTMVNPWYSSNITSSQEWEQMKRHHINYSSRILSRWCNRTRCREQMDSNNNRINRCQEETNNERNLNEKRINTNLPYVNRSLVNNFFFFFFFYSLCVHFVFKLKMNVQCEEHRAYSNSLLLSILN
jgi:hypothetical protein